MPPPSHMVAKPYFLAARMQAVHPAVACTAPSDAPPRMPQSAIGRRFTFKLGGSAPVVSPCHRIGAKASLTSKINIVDLQHLPVPTRGRWQAKVLKQ